MLFLEVLSPLKTQTLYEFRCRAGGERSWPRETLRRAGTRLLGRGFRVPREIRVGFRAVDHRIPHHEVWDGFYPLLFLTRNGGPLFGKGHDRAAIRFRYPIPRRVRDFFVGRAASFGIEIAVEAGTTDAALDAPTEGTCWRSGAARRAA